MLYVGPLSRRSNVPIWRSVVPQHHPQGVPTAFEPGGGGAEVSWVRGGRIIPSRRTFPLRRRMERRSTPASEVGPPGNSLACSSLPRGAWNNLEVFQFEVLERSSVLSPTAGFPTAVPPEPKAALRRGRQSGLRGFWLSPLGIKGYPMRLRRPTWSLTVAWYTER